VIVPVQLLTASGHLTPREITPEALAVKALRTGVTFGPPDARCSWTARTPSSAGASLPPSRDWDGLGGGSPWCGVLSGGDGVVKETVAPSLVPVGFVALMR
jgi:hypothetical protein